MDSFEVYLQPPHALRGTSSRVYTASVVDDDQTIVPNTLRLTNPVGGIGQSPADIYRDQLRLATAPIREELRLVEQFLRKELQVGKTHVREMLSYVAELGGKRLRPCLLLLAAKASGLISEETIRLSVVVELVHTATLVHDDVLDGAIERRHKETVHQKWSVPASVLVGDWLFTNAYGLANQGTSTIPGRWIAEAAKQVCEGEIMQENSIRHFEMEIPEYMRFLEAKTGALCALSCSLGAWSAGADDATCHRMQQFGLKLGTAFQVFDDWLDVWGRQDHAGKTLGTDLASFKPTLPAMRTLEWMPDQVRKAMIKRLNNGESAAAEELRLAMDRCDASDYTKNISKAMVEDAVRSLDDLPASASVTALRQLAIASVERQG